MSLLESLAVMLGIANIILIIRRSVWNYPFGIAMVALYMIIFWQSKLYSDSGLQAFFAVVQCYGWWSWSREKHAAGEIIVQRLRPNASIMWIGVSIVATLGWGYFMASITDATHPYWDASVAMLSIVAQLLLIWRFLENWWWWIVIDVISIPLYIVKELYLTAGLYAMFLALAITGLIQWRRVYQQQ